MQLRLEFVQCADQLAAQQVAGRFTGDDARYVLRDGFMSPPPQPGAPAPGGAMDSDAFPVI